LVLARRWSLIAGQLPGRTDNEIKNYWNTHIKRKLLARGIDPQTHRPLAAAAPGQQQQHYQLEPQKRHAAAAPGHHHHHPQDRLEVLSDSPEACSRSSDDEPRSATPPPPAPAQRRRLDIDLNLSISLAPYQPPEEYSTSTPPAQEALAAAMPTAAGRNNATAAVCLCLNSLGYRPGVECACGGGAAARHQEQWARNFLQAAAAHCYRGQ